MRLVRYRFKIKSVDDYEVDDVEYGDNEFEIAEAQIDFRFLITFGEIYCRMTNTFCNIWVISILGSTLT